MCPTFKTSGFVLSLGIQGCFNVIVPFPAPWHWSRYGLAPDMNGTLPFEFEIMLVFVCTNWIIHISQMGSVEFLDPMFVSILVTLKCLSVSIIAHLISIFHSVTIATTMNLNLSSIELVSGKLLH